VEIHVLLKEVHGFEIDLAGEAPELHVEVGEK
jgi:hypothetical protein